MLNCPAEYPFAIAYGQHCCKMPFKVNNPVLNPECDGSHLTWKSKQICCQDFQPCLYICTDKKGKKGILNLF